MRINNHSRWDIPAVPDQFKKNGKLSGGIAGYGSFVGWILELLGYAITYEKQALNRKSAVHSLKRHGENLNENASAKLIQTRMKADVAKYMAQKQGRDDESAKVISAPSDRPNSEKKAEDVQDKLPSDSPEDSQKISQNQREYIPT